MTERIESLGAAIITAIESLGAIVTFFGAAIFYIFAPPYKFGLTIRQIREIGADSMFLIVLIAASIGAVLGLQGVNTLGRFGAEGSLGSVVALVLVRELGPVMAALMITARAGSAMAAELGSMQATEQIDALTVMAINPVQYLVSPRILAGVVSFPLLTSVFDVVGIMGGYVVGVGLMGVPSFELFQRHRVQSCLARHLHRTLESAGVRTRRDLDMLLQGVQCGTDGDRNQPRDDRSRGGFQRFDSAVGLFPDLDSLVEFR